MTYYQLTPAQKNIENIMAAYADESICHMGGYFQLADELIEPFRQLAAQLPHIHPALSLRHVRPGVLFRSDASPDIEEFFFPAANSPEISRLIRRWIEAPFPENGALCGFALFHFGNICYGCEKAHHLIMDRAAWLSLIQFHYNYAKCLQKDGKAAINGLLTPDVRYLELLTPFDEPAAARAVQASSATAKIDDAAGKISSMKEKTNRERTVRWLKKYYSDTSRAWIDRERSFSSRSESLKIPVEQELFQQLRKYAKSHHITPESIWYAAILTERCKRRGIRHAVVGRMTENRKQSQHDIVGLFSNVMPVSFSLPSPEETDALSSLAASLSEQFLIGLRHQDYSLAELRRIVPESCTAYDTLISWHPSRLALEMESFYTMVDCPYIETPLRIWIHDIEDAPSLEYFYQTECYTGDEVSTLAARQLFVLQQLLFGVPLRDITLLSEYDRERYRLLNTAVPVSPTLTIPERFCQTAERFAGQTALKDDNHSFTYHECVSLYHDICHWLQSMDFAPGSLAGLHVGRNAMLPLYMLAVMGCGGAFLPIPPEDSALRKSKLAADCSLVICDRDHPLAGGHFFESAGDYHGKDNLSAQKGEPPAARPGIPLREQCAYQLYTSGTTAKPRAARISQYSLMCRLEWMYQRYHLSGVTIQKTRYSFDVSLWELLLPLAYGGCLYVLPDGKEQFPDILTQKMISENVENVHFVPGMLHAWLNELEQTAPSEKLLPSLRHIFASGEALPAEDVDRAGRLLPHVQLHNLYGPTECTIDVSYYDFPQNQPSPSPVPIGRAVANTRLYVLSPSGDCILPVGAIGELCVTGDLVGMGYAGKNSGGYTVWNNENAYLTGDLAHLGEDGMLYLHGRKDSQQKLRGMRVDTTAVCSLLNRFPGIKDSFAAVTGNCLTAWYEAEKPITGIAGYLSEKLPYYSVPGQLYHIKTFPRQTNGKLDVKSLLSYRDNKKADKNTESGVPRSPLEKELWQVIRPKIPGGSLRVHDNLISLGIDSLTAIEIIQELKQRNINISYDMLYTAPTIRQLAAGLHRNQQAPENLQTCRFLRRYAGSTLLICVPYGGGDAEIYGKLADALEQLPWDIVVTKPFSDSQTDIPHRAAALLNELALSGGQRNTPLTEPKNSYHSYILFGYCVGSALTVELARQMAARSLNIRRIYIAASLPTPPIHVGGRSLSPWALLSDTALQKLLHWLGGFADIDKIRQFRRDTDQFFRYMDNIRPLPGRLPVTLLFADKDPLTAGWKRRYRKWKTFFTGKITIRLLRKTRHYFTPQTWTTIGKMMKRDEESHE